MTWYLLSVFLHVFSAMIWVGGIFFLAIVAVPAARRFSPDERSRLVTLLGRRFRAIGWAALLVLIVTGLINVGFRGATWQNVVSGEYFITPFGSRLAVKLGVVLLMIAVSGTHDWLIGPLTSRRSEAGQDITGLRRLASWLARATGLLAALIVLLAVLMVRGG